jgi:hypothetical protein
MDPYSHRVPYSLACLSSSKIPFFPVLEAGVTPLDTANIPSYHAFYRNGSHPKFPRFATGVDAWHQPLPEPPFLLEVATNYIPDLVLPPFAGSSESTSYALMNALASDPPYLPVTGPSARGLPVSSAPGALASSPCIEPSQSHIQLGPVDMSCPSLWDETIRLPHCTRYSHVLPSNGV